MSTTPFDLIYEVLSSNLPPQIGLTLLRNTFGVGTKYLIDHVEVSMYQAPHYTNYAGRPPTYFEGGDIPAEFKHVSGISVAWYDGTISSGRHPELEVSASDSPLHEGYASQSEDKVALELSCVASSNFAASVLEEHVSGSMSAFKPAFESSGVPININDTIERKCRWDACDAVLLLKGSSKDKERTCREHINTHHFVDCMWRGCICKKPVNKRCGNRQASHPAHIVDIAAHLIRHYEVG